jgi:hypothetical protein
MNLNRKQLEKVLKLLDSTGAENVTLEQHPGSGIGHILEATVTIEAYGHEGFFTVEITGVEDW